MATLAQMRAAVEAVKDTDTWYFSDTWTGDSNYGYAFTTFAQIGAAQLTERDKLTDEQLELIGKARAWLTDLLAIAEASQEVITYVRTGGGALTFHCPFCGNMKGDEPAHRDDCDLLPLMKSLEGVEGDAPASVNDE